MAVRSSLTAFIVRLGEGVLGVPAAAIDVASG